MARDRPLTWPQWTGHVSPPPGPSPGTARSRSISTGCGTRLLEPCQGTDPGHGRSRRVGPVTNACRSFHTAPEPRSRSYADLHAANPPPRTARRPLSRDRPRGRRHAPLPRHRRLPRLPADPARRDRTLQLGCAGALLHGHPLPPRLRGDAGRPLRRNEAPQRALRPLLQRPLRPPRPRLRRPLRRPRHRGRGPLLRGVSLRSRQPGRRRALPRRERLAVDVVRVRRRRGCAEPSSAEGLVSSRGRRRARCPGRRRAPWRPGIRSSPPRPPRESPPRRAPAPGPRPTARSP